MGLRSCEGPWAGVLVELSKMEQLYDAAKAVIRDEMHVTNVAKWRASVNAD